MIDGKHDYSRHSDAELRDRIYGFPYAEQPRNADIFVRELEKRWFQAEQRLAAQNSADAVTRGAAFGELDAPTAKAFFWPYIRYCLWIGLIYAIAYMGVFIGLALVNAIVMRVSTGASSGGLPSAVLSLTASFLLLIPFSRFYLKRITRKPFAGYGLRIVRDPVPVSSGQASEQAQPGG
jgi:hypothetical protein